MDKEQGHQSVFNRPVAAMAPCEPLLTGLVNSIFLSLALWAALDWTTLLLLG